MNSRLVRAAIRKGVSVRAILYPSGESIYSVHDACGTLIPAGGRTYTSTAIACLSVIARLVKP